MVLIKFNGFNDKPLFLCNKKNTSEEVNLILLCNVSEQSFNCKVGYADEAVRKWSKVLNLSPEEYLCQLSLAVSKSSVFDSSSGEHEDLFEIEKKDKNNNHLLWKQYFPSKKLYGRKGKFKLENINYQDGVNEVLTLLITHLDDNNADMTALRLYNDQLKAECKEAEELAHTSVNMKEQFERQIYSKFIAIIKPKTDKIQQLKAELLQSTGSNHECTKVNSNYSSTSIATSNIAGSSNVVEKDEFDNDTDIDEPEDVDTDDEDTSVLKRKSEGKTYSNKNKVCARPAKVMRILDSQDVLNQSLDAELEAVAQTTIKKSSHLHKRFTQFTEDNISTTISSSINLNKPSDHIPSTGDSSVSETIPSNDSGDSILKELF